MVLGIASFSSIPFSGLLGELRIQRCLVMCASQGFDVVETLLDVLEKQMLSVNERTLILTVN